jgi:hypothetical protein
VPLPVASCGVEQKEPTLGLTVIHSGNFLLFFKREPTIPGLAVIHSGIFNKKEPIPGLTAIHSGISSKREPRLPGLAVFHSGRDISRNGKPDKTVKIWFL